MLVFLLFKKESESDYMLTIETKELNISEELKKKVDMLCKFVYVKSHIMTINEIDYLMFDECDDIYINGYDKKIKFKDLLEYIKNGY